MTQHLLQGRDEKEIMWFQRRDTLRAAAAWVALGGLPAAMAQQRSNIVDLSGDALLNGRRLDNSQVIQTGDQIQTGPGSRLVFALGNASFLVRQNTRMEVERGSTLNVVSIRRVLTGAVASVWGKGAGRSIITPTLTAGIRGTGAYTEVPAGEDRTYFCNCYGQIDLDAGGAKAVSRSDYHQSFWAETGPGNTPVIRSAGYLNHTDEELELLAGLINQRTYWQIMGRKGTPDGKGTMGY